MDILSKLRTLSSYRILKPTQLYGPGIEQVVVVVLLLPTTYTPTGSQTENSVKTKFVILSKRHLTQQQMCRKSFSSEESVITLFYIIKFLKYTIQHIVGETLSYSLNKAIYLLAMTFFRSSRSLMFF